MDKNLKIKGCNMRIYFKKVMAVVSIAGVLVISGCQKVGSVNPIEIAALNGPTGIGMVKLMSDQENVSKKYNINLYESPDEIVGKVVSGEVDIACVPSNMGAVLYNKTDGEVELLGTNTLGVLYIVENGDSIQTVEDLRGKTILSSGKDSTPEFVLNHILEANGIDPATDINIEFMGSHADIASKVVTEEGSIALLPQPFVTTVLANNEQMKAALDVNEIWKNAENMDLPMGIMIGKKVFAMEESKQLKNFLKAYEQSVKFVVNNPKQAAALTVAYGIILDVEIAKKAIPACNIVYKDAEGSREMLTKFYEILGAANPKSIGGKVPDEAFYASTK